MSQAVGTGDREEDLSASAGRLGPRLRIRATQPMNNPQTADAPGRRRGASARRNRGCA
jgi:hypothetical protein